MNVLLVGARRSAYTGEAISAPQQGLLMLAAVLREGTFHATRDVDVEVVDDQLDVIDQPWLPPGHCLAGRQADVVGVQTVTSSLKNGVKLLDEVRARLPGALTVLGGVGPTPVAEQLVARGDADVVVRGEGEYAFSSLVAAWRDEGAAGLRDVPGITFRSCDGAVRSNPSPPQVPSLDALPVPARDLVDMARYRRISRGRSGNLITSRGCSYACAYCYSRHQWGVGQRRHGVARVVREIRILADDYGLDRIRIEDDDFLEDRAWAFELCDTLEAEGLAGRVEWEAKARPDHLDDELATRLRRAGCFRLLVGVETLDPALLRRLGRPLKIAMLMHALRCLQRAGIGIQATMILGIPGETNEAMRHTIGWLQETLGGNRHDIISPCFFVPFNHEVERAMSRRMAFTLEVQDTDAYTGHIPVTSSPACSSAELWELYDDMSPDRRGRYDRIAHLAPLDEVQRRTAADLADVVPEVV